MKTLILAACIMIIGLAGCSISEPAERVYYPQQRVYTTPVYDPNYNSVYDSRYTTRRVYDYNTGRYYDVPVYNNNPVYSPVYTTPAYPNRNYGRDSYRRDTYRRDNGRKDYYQVPQSRTPQPVVVEQPREKKYPDGSRVTSDGTVILPNGQVKRKQ